MRLCTFSYAHGKTVPGAIVDDRVIDLERAFREHRGLTDRIADLGALIAHPLITADGPPAPQIAQVLEVAAGWATHAGAPGSDAPGGAPALDAVRLRAPLRRPTKIIATGLNYRDHAEEQNREPPAAPMLFNKAPTSVIGPDDEIVLPAGREKIDLEVELGVVIGTPATAPVAKERALDHVLGFTIVNDVSDRAAQRSDKQFFRAKSWRTFAPMGPVVVTPDALAPDRLALTSRLNGETMQRSDTSNLIFGVADLIAYVSSFCDLEAGDVISTGTPGGVGVFRDPPVFLAPGDAIECEIEGIGVLRNRVRAAADGEPPA